MNGSLSCLIVYKTEYNKIRVGSVHDGGYVICDGINYDLLLSCGISDDITFEDDFTSKYSVNCLAYDGTIDHLPHYTNPHIQFIKKNISNKETEYTTNLLDVVNSNKNIFLKMDIETFEYQWIQLLSESQLNKFKQIVIEFHFPFTYSEEIFRPRSYPMEIEEKIECLRKLADTHYLVHLHGNNCCGVTIYDNIKVPNVFECTYVRKDLCNTVSVNTDKIPHPLDTPNVAGPDIELSEFPFSV